MSDGIIIIDKPADWTSHDVVAKLRGLYRQRRIGHGGTLDPMATGVLPVFLGRATRAVEYAAAGDKEYLAGLRLGVVTDTQDMTGTILHSSPAPVTPQTLERVLDRFRGAQQQIPPMYSAIKVQGKKLYELARKGQEVARAPRDITVHSLSIEHRESQADYLLRVRCSKGTYVRTLCHDIGAALGCGGTMYTLRRTMAADFTLAQCHTLDQVALAAQEGRAGALLAPVDICFSQYPSLVCNAEEERRFIRNGTPYPSAGPEGIYRVYSPEGDFLMLGRRSAAVMSTEKSFFSVDGW